MKSSDPRLSSGSVSEPCRRTRFRVSPEPLFVFKCEKSGFSEASLEGLAPLCWKGFLELKQSFDEGALFSYEFDCDAKFKILSEVILFILFFVSVNVALRVEG